MQLPSMEERFGPRQILEPELLTSNFFSIIEYTKDIKHTRSYGAQGRLILIVWSLWQETGTGVFSLCKPLGRL